MLYTSLMKTCTFNDCDTKLYAKGLCALHYSRKLKGRTMNTVNIKLKRAAIVEGDIAKIPLGVNAQRGYAIVDKEYAYLAKYNWSLDGYGYPCGWAEGKVRKLHHLVIGTPPDLMVTDHINRNKLDARRTNLKHVTYKENSANIPKELFNKRTR